MENEIIYKAGCKKQVKRRQRKIPSHTILQPGDRALVRNLLESGETGKIRSYWQPEIHRVIEGLGDLPVTYKIQPEHNPKAKVQILHRNQLHLCDNLLDNFNWNIKIDHEKTNTRQERKAHHIQPNVRKRRPIKDQSDTDSSGDSDLKEVQITPSGFKRLVQEELTRQNKVQDEVIDFRIECKEPPREVVGRTIVEGREEETITKEASE